MWSIINTALFGMVLASSMQTTGIKVTYVSKPGFAIVREGTRVLGITPLTIVYTPSEAWPDCFFGNEIKITWFSGAETTLRPTVCPDMDNTYIVERPSGVVASSVISSTLNSPKRQLIARS